ncbi:hypothetical protein Pma05_24420 [Plantactinospora mayteni]|uniref:Uncharacterized protein n=1 Tax=Plantactinospora mayteni TaxID=566021 RepID=A0ABQ4EMJ0_9ACTN|nr:hypothetical protein Pma05_24420 [Plantactinospora mayteni]
MPQAPRPVDAHGPQALPQQNQDTSPVTAAMIGPPFGGLRETTLINIDDNYYGGNPRSQSMFLKVFFTFAAKGSAPPRPRRSREKGDRS